MKETKPKPEYTLIGEKDKDRADEWYCDWYRCPKCKEIGITRSFSYCPDCGIKLMWQQEDIVSVESPPYLIRLSTKRLKR